MAPTIGVASLPNSKRSRSSSDAVARRPSGRLLVRIEDQTRLRVVQMDSRIDSLQSTEILERAALIQAIIIPLIWADHDARNPQGPVIAARETDRANRIRRR
jgi:hypothetical protein